MTIDNNIDYFNECLSEYIGSHILESLGYEAHETLLGTYKIKNKEKIVVACKDFCVNGFNIYDFVSQLSNLTIMHIVQN